MNTHDMPLVPAPSDPPQRLPLWKRGLEHAVKISMCGYSVNVGIMLLFRVGTNRDLPKSLAELPIFLILMLCVFTVVGGTSAIMGMFGTNVNLRKQLNSEQIGWLLLFLGWAGYVISALAYAPTPQVLMSIAPWLAAGSLGRLIWLTQVERALDQKVEEDEGDVPNR